MTLFEFLTICPPEIKVFLFTDKSSQVVIYLIDKYQLTGEESDQMVDLIRDLLLGLVAVDDLQAKLSRILSRQPEMVGEAGAVLRKSIIEPNIKFLKQTAADVQKFKQDNDLPEVVVFTVPKPKNPVPVNQGPVKPTSQGPVPTTADIRRPVKRVVPPATPVKPAVPSPQPVSPKLEQFQLRTTDDLINVPPVALAKEPDDEKQLVGRFKQEIQDISNYSGAKRVEIVAAWKKSQLYHTYIEMGNESMQQGKPIRDVASFRKAGGKPFLTENQFHAISEVSRLLLR